MNSRRRGSGRARPGSGDVTDEMEAVGSGTARRPTRVQIRRRRRTAVGVVVLVGVIATLTLRGRDGGSVPARAELGVVPTPAAVAPSPPSNTAAPDRAIRVTAVGDVMMGTPAFGLPAGGGASLFASVGPLLRGDLVIANLEGTLATGGASKCGATPSPTCYAFQSPPGYATDLRSAGVDVVNLANNHSGDFGASAREQTREALAGAGVLSTGAPEGAIAYREVAGGRVAVIGFGFSDQMNSVLDPERAEALVEQATRRAGVVIVAMHVGAEGRDHQHLTFATETYLGENRGDPVAFARAMIDAGADLVVGHGPHVMRAMEVYRGRLIAYSLGNFVGYGGFSISGESGESAVLSVRLARDGRLLGGRLTSVVLRGRGIPQPGGDSVARVRSLGADDLGRRSARIAIDGSIAAAPAG